MPVKRHRNTRWGFRLLALAVGVGAIVAVEGLCRLAGWGEVDPLPDPFPGFAATEPLFDLNRETSRFEIRPQRLKFFVPDSFPAEKATNEFRVFCLGGSTVQGRPYAKETAFTAWLRLSLEAASPGRRWTVVNCGGVSYASYRLRPILEECLQYEPDLVILCTGHNEFLEERSYGRFKSIPQSVLGVLSVLRQMRISRLLAGAVTRFGEPSDDPPAHIPPSLPREVDALLDYRDGIKAYHRNERWQAGVIAHFRHAVRGMIAQTKVAGVPIILVLPPSNLKDCPPFKSQHREELTGAARERWQFLTRGAQEALGTDPAHTIDALREAVRINDQHALTQYRLGKSFEAIARPRRALEHFQKARDLDVCPLRMLGVMEETLADIAKEERIRLLDVNRLLRRECQFEILGDEILVDHVHPSLRGHQRIAFGLAEMVFSLEGIAPADGWEDKRDRAYQKHLDALEPLYFTRGQLRLRSLQAWTQGRADGPPIESRAPRAKGVHQENR